MTEKTTVYRIQDDVGRGPFRPGFSHRWADDSFTAGCKAFPTWMEEFGDHLIQKRGRPGEHFGSAVRSIEKLCEWFSPTERLKLAAMGFNAVSVPKWVIPAALVVASLAMFGVSYGLQMLIRRLYPRNGENL
jgi:hypothetical protein